MIHPELVFPPPIPISSTLQHPLMQALRLLPWLKAQKVIQHRHVVSLTLRHHNRHFLAVMNLPNTCQQRPLVDPTQ